MENEPIRLTSFGQTHNDPPPDLTARYNMTTLYDPGYAHANKDRATYFRAMNGRDHAELRAEVLRDGIARLIVAGLVSLARPGDHLGIYCVGGRHRSPSIVEEVATRLRAAGHTVVVTHRHVDRREAARAAAKPDPYEERRYEDRERSRARAAGSLPRAWTGQRTPQPPRPQPSEGGLRAAEPGAPKVANRFDRYFPGNSGGNHRYAP